MKRLIKALMVSVALICLASGGTYIWARGSLPMMDGTIELAGITAPIRITRDRNAVPHIYAESVEDVMFGLGFAHAQDRLWQMEINRRIGAGRLSEVLGAATAGTDRFLRTVGVRRAAERTYDELDQGTRAILDSYAAGDECIPRDPRCSAASRIPDPPPSTRTLGASGLSRVGQDDGLGSRLELA